MGKPELSVVVITLNEQDVLPRLLKSLMNQTMPYFEIIVADANSTDNTRKIARKYDCEIVRGGMASVGRNNGARMAKSDYLLFLDADGELPNDFIEVNLKAFKKSKMGTATVQVKPLSDRYFDKIFFKLYDYWVHMTKSFSPHASGASFFIKKSVFKKVGGFNEKIVFAEDHAMAVRTKEYGFTVLPIPIYTSVRRLDKDGRFKFVCKYIYSGLYRIFYKEIDRPLFEYDNKR